MRVAGESENYGPEQAHLNQVEGAHLQITGLKANSGPGIEFLEYLKPGDGRPMPADSRVNDLWHWHVTLGVSDIQNAAQALTSADTQFVSPGVVALPDTQLGFTQGLMIRDPNGHALRLVKE